MNTNKGFTLIELIVVVVIIAILSTLGLNSYSRIQSQSKEAKVTTDLKTINTAILRLSSHTYQLPAHLSFSTCVGNPEVYINNCAAGLTCTDGNFPNWQGPYLEELPIDPWGNQYFFDPDYACHTYVKGCEDVPDNTTVRALLSIGPDGSGSYTSADNIVSIMCR